MTDPVQAESSRLLVALVSMIVVIVSDFCNKRRRTSLRKQAERDRAEWEAEIERDSSSGGAGSALVEEIKADVRAGRFRRFEEGRPQKR